MESGCLESVFYGPIFKKCGKITAKTIDFFLFQSYTIFNKRGPVFARKTVWHEMFLRKMQQYD